jgi:O-antigen ligase
MAAVRGRRSLPLATIFDVGRDRAAWISLFFLLLMVIVGLSPLGDKSKTLVLTGDGDINRQIAYIMVFGLMLITSGTFKEAARLFVIPWSVTIVIGYCLVSLTWSISPAIAIRRLALTIIIIWTVFDGVQRVGYDRAINILRILLVLTLILNYVAILTVPTAIHQVAEVGDMNLIGNWRGILMQKNIAGAVCAVTIILFVFDANKLPLVFRVGVIIATTFFLYKTMSKTSMSLLVLVLATGGAFKYYNPKYRLFCIPVAVFIVFALGIGLYMSWPSIESTMANPETLTGRSQIWPVLMAYWSDHWLLGSGFGSFWNTGQDSPINSYATNWVAKLGNGHNGYLDLLVQLGLPGLLLVVTALVFLPLGKLFASRTLNRSRGAMLIAMLCFCACHNMSETSLLDRDMIVQAFFMLAIALIGVATKPLRTRTSLPVAESTAYSHSRAR